MYKNLQETKMYEISKMEDRKNTPKLFIWEVSIRKWGENLFLLKPGKSFTFLLFFWRFFGPNLDFLFCFIS